MVKQKHLPWLTLPGLLFEIKIYDISTSRSNTHIYNNATRFFHL